MQTKTLRTALLPIRPFPTLLQRGVPSSNDILVRHGSVRRHRPGRQELLLIFAG